MMGGFDLSTETLLILRF